ncbi:unnamed protein product [Ranitomeya imitator]|uniref:Uncharacterized protein n=1 Tax=Ranitomeya imitator TaxID=111125 RepID=A0ABN9KMD1_9NEOB|nr:unnamed protein product [Ranitomeya imitator]
MAVMGAAMRSPACHGIHWHPVINYWILKEESSAFYSSARLWDDGVILPQDTRPVLGKCLKIIRQKKYEKATSQSSPLLRM